MEYTLKAKELKNEIENSFIPDQFNNPANARAHFETTGPEIWEDTDGQVDIFVAGVGTGGTVTGTGEVTFFDSANEDFTTYGTATVSAPTEMIQSLKEAGVDLLQMANSCVINNGLNGLTATLDAIRSAGIEPKGKQHFRFDGISADRLII